MAGGFAYTKDEMLHIYKEGHFKAAEFTDKFQHVANATTPEYLIPLALLPIEPEEQELRKAPVVVGPPANAGRGRGFQDRDGGRGRGRGRDDGGKGGKGGDRDGGKGWHRNNISGDVRNSGGATPWDHERPSRGQRDSGGAGGGGDMDARLAPPRGQSMPAPPPPREWFYRDLEGMVQGPFSEAQISEWYTAGFLPAELPMRPDDGPAEAYTPLNELVAAGSGEPPFVKAHRLRTEYEAERDRTKGALDSRRADDGEMGVQGQQHAQDAAQQQAAAAQAAAQQQQQKRESEAQAAAQRHAEEASRQQAELEARRARQAEAEAEMHRNMIEEARRRAEEEARRVADEERRRVLEEARREAEEEARRYREELQMRQQAEAEMMARQQAEELARRQSALEEVQRRQAESEELARRQSEELARRQAAMQEQQRVLSMLPPAGTPGAGSALLSLLQGAPTNDGSAGGASALSGLPAWSGQQPPPAAPPASQQTEADAALWSAIGGAGGGAAGGAAGTASAAQAACNGADLAGWGRGRGRGRGVCSAALGTNRRGESGESNTLLSALGAMGLESSAESDLPISGMAAFAQYSVDDAQGVSVAEADGGLADEGSKKGRKSKRDKKKGDSTDPAATHSSPAAAAAAMTMTPEQAEEAAFQAALEASRNQPQPGQIDPAASQQSTFSGWSTDRASTITLAQIQAQEEIERQRREAEAMALAEQRRNAAAASGTQSGSAWASGNLPSLLNSSKPPPATAVGGGAKPAGGSSGGGASFAELMAQQQGGAGSAGKGASATPPRPATAAAAVARSAPPATASREDDDGGLLWDYGAAPAPVNSASPTKGAAQTPPAGTKGKKKGKSGTEAPTEGNGAAAQAQVSESSSAFGLGGPGDGQMPASMSSWCAQQMLALTGNDDTTLADFLFSLQADDEVHSYLTMYLGGSKAVDAFAKEFTLRKRAARGTGESREWQTAGRKNAKDASPANKNDEDANGFQTKGRKGRGKKVADPSLLGFSVESSRIMQGEIDFPE